MIRDGDKVKRTDLSTRVAWWRVRFPPCFDTKLAITRASESNVPVHAVGTESEGEKAMSNADVRAIQISTVLVLRRKPSSLLTRHCR